MGNGEERSWEMTEAGCLGKNSWKEGKRGSHNRRHLKGDCKTGMEKGKIKKAFLSPEQLFGLGSHRSSGASSESCSVVRKKYTHKYLMMSPISQILHMLEVSVFWGSRVRREVREEISGSPLPVLMKLTVIREAQVRNYS